MATTKVSLAQTEAQIQTCYAVLAQLRPELTAASFRARIQEQAAAGYRLAFIEDQGTVAAVAGFRIGHNLAWGRFLYVDDLVTDSARRSQGYGGALLEWLLDHARQHGCAQLHLDSGVQRTDAHRFYRRQGLALTSYHFSTTLLDPTP